jgi:O-antigen/teichoic acid export membrane protein
VASLAALLPSGIRRFGWDSLVRNSVWILATSATNLIAGFAFVFIVTRNWEPHQVGVSASVLSGMGLAALIADLGVAATLIQTLPRQTSDAAWSTLLNTFLSVGACAGLVAGVGAALVTRLAVPATTSLIDSPEGILLVVVGVPSFVVGSLVVTSFVAERRSEIMLLQTVLSTALRLSLVLLLAHSTDRAIGIAASTILASFVMVPLGLFVLVPYVRRGHRRLRRTSLRSAREARGMFAGHYLINLAGAGPVLLMPVLVATRLSASDAAYYYAAWAVGGALFSISSSVASSLFAEGSHDTAALPRLVRRSAVVTICLLTPAMAVSALLGDRILHLFGSEYAHRGVGLFLLVVGSAIPQAMITIYVSVLRVAGLLTQAVYLYVATGAVAMAGAWFLLPGLGVTGAGVAWFGGQTLGACVACVAWARARARAPERLAPSEI